MGAFCGSDMPAEAILLAMLIIVGNTLLRPLVNAINRAPLDTRASEATYELQVTAEAADLARVRREVVARLLAAHYPVSDVDVVERTDDCVEIVATLVSTAVEPKELDAVVADLVARPDVRDAAWSARTAD